MSAERRTGHVALVALLLGGLLAGSGCRRDEVVFTPATLTDDDGKMSTLRPGTRVRTRESWLVGEASDVHVKVHDGREGRVSAAVLRPFPMRGEPRFVAVPSTFEYTEPRRKNRKRRHRLGQKLEVVDALLGSSAVIQEGVPVGFVRTAATRTTPPTADSLYSLAAQQLRLLDLKAAVESAEAALTLDAEHEPSLELVWASHIGVDWKRARELKTRLRALRPEARPWPALEVEPVTLGAAFTTASKLRLRGEPSAKSKVLSYLEIGTPVRVTKTLDDDWVEGRSPRGMTPASAGRPRREREF
jgi:hypothetical protein